MAVNCLETETTAKTELGVMGTPSSRFAMPYPCSYTSRPFRLMPTPQPGESDLFHSAKSRSTRAAMKGVRHVDRSPRGTAPVSRRPQSPPSEGPSQGPARGWRRAVDRGCAVQDRAPLRVCELAEAQGAHRLPGGDRATQAGDR